MYARDGFVLICDRSGLVTLRDTIQKKMSKILKDNAYMFQQLDCLCSQ